jgi:Amt family ammonium transporter
VQAGAALTVIVWDALITFLILKFLGLFMKLRMSDEDLEIGDVAAHEEEAYPDDALVAARDGANRPAADSPVHRVEAEPATD